MTTTRKMQQCPRFLFALICITVCLAVQPSYGVLLNRIGSSSASSLSMAGAGQATAFHPGPQSTALNPAGLVTVDGIELFVGDISLWSDFEYDRHATLGGGHFDAYKDIFQFPEFAVAWRINEQWIVGAELWVPYGLAADLRSDLSQNFYHHQAEIFDIQGTFAVAYQFNDDFSLGGSLDINYTELEFNLPYFNSGVFVGTNGNQGDGIGLGGSFGALWTPGDWRFGMKYQMPVKVDINGHTDFTAALGLGRQDFDTVVHIPQRIQLGVAYQISERWGVAFDAQYTDYERNNILELDYVAPLPNGQLPLHWEDIIGLHAGNSIKMTDKLTWEQGVGYLTYGAPDETMLPAIPDASGFVVDTGIKYDWNDHVSTYLSVAYAWGDRDIGYTATRKAPGEMEASLFLLGAGLHYKF